MTLSTSPTSVGSRADVGSSNSSTFGSIVSARAIATRCFWPPDRRAGYSSRFSDRPTFARYFSAVAIASSFDTPLTWTGASMRLPITDRCGNRLNSWNTIWARSRIWRICSRWSPVARVERVARRRGSRRRRRRPAVGSSRKLRQRRNVLLPDPERPMRQIVSRG